jgi:AcrR family transcriptional regulator
MAERGRPRSFDRDAALGRAMELFWTKGYEAASMSELTGAMGIASPSLYAAFGCKENLFREAVALYRKVHGAEIWNALARAQTAFEAIKGFLMESARVFTRSGKPSGCLVVLSALHVSESCETVRAELIKIREHNVKELTDRLKQGVEAGELAADVVLEPIARYYVTVQQGMSIQARDGANRKTLEAIAAAAIASWESLTGVREPTRKQMPPATPPLKGKQRTRWRG